jgi:hypothetical protein
VETLTLPGTGDTTITPVTTQGTVIPSPYSSAEVDELQFAQSNDFLFIAHKDHRPAQLTRTSDTQWAFDDVDFIDGPYLDENVIDTDTITTTARSLGDRTSLTLSDAAIINDGDGWKSTDIGRIVRFKSTGGSNDIPGYVEIDDIQSPTVAAGKILQQVYGAVGAKYKWRLGAWYQGNYPRAVSFAEQRLCFGGEPDAPNFITTSNTGKFNVMRPTALNHEATVEDTHSLRVAIADNHLQTVLWLSNARTLLAGSESAVFAIRASVDGEAFAPTNINAVKVAAIGSDAVQPVSVADRVVFPTRNGQGLRGMVADSQDAENSVPDDVAILARHVFGRIERIEEIAYQFDRRSVVWMVRSDGVLLGCTYVPEQQVFAWHQHKLGGSFDGGDAVVESVGVAQAGGTGHDRVWLVVKRTVGSTTVRHVEFFEDEWTDGVATSQRYVDSHPAAYSGAATTQFGGFAHLVGETVQVLGDGAVLEDAVVEEAPAGYGRIVTDREYTDLVAGYGYTSTFESLPLEIPDQRGTSMGKAKRADHVVLRLWDSHTGEVATIGWDGEPRSWSPVIQRGAGDVHGSPVAPFTGDKSVNVEGESTMDLRIRIRQTQPVAFNLLAMTVEGEIGGN